MNHPCRAAEGLIDLANPYSWSKDDGKPTKIINVRDRAGDETMFKVKKTTKLSEVFKHYAERKKIADLTLMRLTRNGEPVHADQTMGDLSMEDNGRLDYSPVTNARHEIEKLLANETSPGAYSTGCEVSRCAPTPTVEVIVRSEDGDELGTKELSFPLDEGDIKTIKDNAEHAGVGVGEQTVVNLDVRKTWQIQPHGLRVSNVEQALETALQVVARDFGTEADYEIEASLYKMLLYEEGCFFARHRDNERLDGMFGTLVLEMPSEYEGAVLSVSSPLTPNDERTYTFNGGGTKRKRRRSNKPGLHFAAFYADCYHQVSKLTSGHRVALVYHLTASPKQGQHRSIFCHVTNQWQTAIPALGQHLPAIRPSPPQPGDESVAVKLSTLVDKLSTESDDDYQDGQEGENSLGKPKKLAIVLSHHYTPASFTRSGLDALKGSDRSLAQMISAAASCSPEATKLARLAAKTVVEEGGEQYAADHSPEALQVQNLVSEEFKKKDNDGPFFDVALSLATVWDHGECTPIPSRFLGVGTGDELPSTFKTIGPLTWLTGEGGASLDFGPQLPCDRIPTGWHPSLFSGQEQKGPPFEFHDPEYMGMLDHLDNGPVIFGEQTCYRNDKDGNHSLPIYSQEILFASNEARCKFRKDAAEGKHVVVENSPKEVEFLGNGGCYMGRMYSRAVILLWPKSHRKDVQMQSKGGRAAAREESNCKKSGN